MIIVENFDDFDDLQSLIDSLYLQPIENPFSECYKCQAGMCDHSRTPACRGDQYQYDDNIWSSNTTEEEIINSWREKKLNEI